jgi:hypothetical protein
MIATPTSDALFSACFGVNHHRLDRADLEDVTERPRPSASVDPTGFTAS